MVFGTKGAILGVLRIVNAGLGILLTLGVAAVFGVNKGIDALFVALFAAVYLARDIGQVTRVALIPCVVEEDLRDGGKEFLSAYRWFALLFGLGLFLLALAGAPLIVRAIAPGFDPEGRSLTVRLIQILSPSLFFYILIGFAGGTFVARRHLYAPAVSQVLWYLAGLAVLFTLGRSHGLEVYAAGLTAAAGLQFGALYLWGRRCGIHLLPTRWTGLRFGVFRRFFKGSTVAGSSLVLLKVEQLADRVALSFMAPGAIAVFSYAARLAYLIPSMVSAGFFTPLAPEIPRVQASLGDARPLAKRVALFLAAIGCPISLLLIWAAPDLVNILLSWGKFTEDSAALVGRAMQWMAIGIPAMFLSQGLRGLFVFQRKLREILYAGALAVVVRAIGNALLSRFGVSGIALSGALTIWIVCLFLWIRIRQPETIHFRWARFLAAAAAMGLVLFAIPWTRIVPWSLVRLPLVSGLALAAYGLIVHPVFASVGGAISGTIRQAQPSAEP